MGTLILGGIIFSTFCTLFYLEDREGGGIYDPDPRPKHQHKRK